MLLMHAETTQHAKYGNEGSYAPRVQNEKAKNRDTIGIIESGVLLVMTCLYSTACLIFAVGYPGQCG